METFTIYLLFFSVLAWSLAWKGLALWRAARKNMRWFIVILLVNSGGFLELVYLYWITKKPKYLWFLGVALAALVILGYLGVTKDPEYWQGLFT